MSAVSGATRAMFSEESAGASDLPELQAQVTSLAITSTLFLATALLFFAALVLNHVGFDTVGVIAGLALTACIARGLMPISSRAAGVVLVAGAVGVLSVAVGFWPDRALAAWFSLLVPLAATILGSWAGVLVALGATAVLTALFGPGWLIWPLNETGSAIVLSWASLFVFWLTSQPARTTAA